MCEVCRILYIARYVIMRQSRHRFTMEAWIANVSNPILEILASHTDDVTF